MKIIDVALKDLQRVFRSAFALIMMFGAPLLIAGLLYFAFGGLAGGDGSFGLARIRVAIANLDQASSPELPLRAGEMLVEFLQDEGLADVLEIRMASDEVAARSAVDAQQADVALIIPGDFSRAALTADREAAVVLYQDPALTIGSGIVKDLVNHFMDGFSGAKIAAEVTNAAIQEDGTQPNPVWREWAAAQYAAYLQSSSHNEALRIKSTAGETAPGESRSSMMGPIMAGMMIFFVFFMGANGAESIIREHEEGTLARLFTTPTSALQILSGKFVGVFATLVLQTTILLAASSLIFGVSWGRPVPVVLAALGLIVAATGFGVMLMSFIKNTRQTGPVLGGVLTVTGMLGGLMSTGMPSLPEVMDKVALTMPQGWAMQAWTLSLAGESARMLILPTLVLMMLGGLFFVIGVTLFRRRFI
jgi:ABC-2 type transport system permease protein